MLLVKLTINDFENHLSECDKPFDMLIIETMRLVSEMLGNMLPNVHTVLATQTTLYVGADISESKENTSSVIVSVATLCFNEVLYQKLEDFPKERGLDAFKVYKDLYVKGTLFTSESTETNFIDFGGISMEYENSHGFIENISDYPLGARAGYIIKMKRS